MIVESISYLLIGYWLGVIAYRNMGSNQVKYPKTLAALSVLFWPVLLTMAIISMVKHGKR